MSLNLIQLLLGEGLQIPTISWTRSQEVLDIPIYWQLDGHSCGVMAAASVLQGLGVDMDIGQVSRILRPSKRYGTPTDRMLKLLRSRGIRCKHRKQLTQQDIRRSIKDGKPVICTIHDPKWPLNTWHWVVIFGWDEDDRTLALGSFRRMHYPWYTWSEFKELGGELQEFIICGG